MITAFSANPSLSQNSRRPRPAKLSFGWSAKTPPTHFTIPIKKEDVTSGLSPAPGFLQKLVPFLLRGNDLNKPGFLLVENSGNMIPEHKMDHFMGRTMVSLKNHLANNHAKEFNPQNVPLTVIKKRQIDGKIQQAGNLHTAETQGKWTLKIPHFDRGSFMVLHRYEPTRNIKQGDLQVIDVKQFLHDHPAERMENVQNPDRTLRQDYQEKLKPYVLTLPTNSRDIHKVVFLHNTDENGVAHSVTPLKMENPDQPFKRVFERYTITRYEPGKTLPAGVTRLDDKK